MYPSAHAQVALWPQRLDPTTLALPMCLFPLEFGVLSNGVQCQSRHCPGSLVLALSPEDPRPGPSPFPDAEVGPGSLGQAACSAVGLTGPLCAETEASFMGATGLGPVENKRRPYGKAARALRPKKKSICLSPQVGAGDAGGSGEQGLGRCVWRGIPGGGLRWGRFRALQPGPGAQGAGLSGAIRGAPSCQGHRSPLLPAIHSLCRCTHPTWP